MGAYFGASLVAFVIYGFADIVASEINANTKALNEIGKALQHCQKE